MCDHAAAKSMGQDATDALKLWCDVYKNLIPNPHYKTPLMACRVQQK